MIQESKNFVAEKMGRQEIQERFWNFVLNVKELAKKLLWICFLWTIMDFMDKKMDHLIPKQSI